MGANQGRRDVAATDLQAADRDQQPTVAELVVAWQESGSHEAFERLVAAALPRLGPLVAATLLGRGIEDPAASDDAIALVLDHLRRLVDTGLDERHVAKFCATRSHAAPSDAGWGYLRQLARSRACDVARERRRQSLVFSQLQSRGGEDFELTIPGSAAGGTAPPPLTDRLREAARSLEPRQRQLVELLLDGKSQAVIAHVLGTSEGTVSRLRARAIKELRRILGL
jgi:RNA polymerase sigma factor (sigma-70 family)